MKAKAACAAWESVFKSDSVMPPYTQLYIHCIWTTWDRLPLITPSAEPRLYAAIRSKCQQFGCSPIAIGGVADHVHLLVEFTPMITLARLIGEVKGASSHVMTHEVAPGRFFKWRGSYGVFTVSKRSLPQVRDYVCNQKIHHARRTLVAELERDDDS
jgi:putative transposase